MVEPTEDLCHEVYVNFTPDCSSLASMVTPWQGTKSRTLISCTLLYPAIACAAFIKESRMRLIRIQQGSQEIRGRDGWLFYPRVSRSCNIARSPLNQR